MKKKVFSVSFSRFEMLFIHSEGRCGPPQSDNQWLAWQSGCSGRKAWSGAHECSCLPMEDTHESNVAPRSGRNWVGAHHASGLHPFLMDQQGHFAQRPLGRCYPASCVPWPFLEYVCAVLVHVLEDMDFQHLKALHLRRTFEDTKHWYILPLEAESPPALLYLCQPTGRPW